MNRAQLRHASSWCRRANTPTLSIEGELPAASLPGLIGSSLGGLGSAILRPACTRRVRVSG